MFRAGAQLARARFQRKTVVGIPSTSTADASQRSLCLFSVGAFGGALAATSTLAETKDETASFSTKMQCRNAETNVDLRTSLLSALPSTNNQARTTCESSSSSIDYEQLYPEAEEFREVLEYYRQQLPWYRKQWSGNKSPISSHWPRNIPNDAETSALEMDVKFCKRNAQLASDDTAAKAAKKNCQDLQFRIASNYVRSKDEAKQFRGYKLLKELAEQEHADGMCLYGIILNEGKVAGVEANPNQAVVWWRRSIDLCMHIPSQYEYAVALYTGEGVPENPSRAVQIFHKAANLHVGAAYMLGECLLDGVGIKRHRAAALEWLIVAAELGHKKAQSRVLAILEGYHDDDDGIYGQAQTEAQSSSSSSTNKKRPDVRLEKRFTIGGASTLEKRFSIGGGSRNPKIRQRRNSIVQDSREDGTDTS